MRRREFMTLLGGAAVSRQACSASIAQEREGMRRIAVLAGTAADDPEQQARIAAFVQGLSQLGWNDGRNAKSIFAGRPPMPTKFADTRSSWSRSHRT